MLPVRVLGAMNMTYLACEYSRLPPRTIPTFLLGAACALALFYILMELELPVRLRLLVPAVENSVGSSSFRPGDVITMKNGMNVEIDSTDSEGRLILAESISVYLYARSFLRLFEGRWQ